MNTARVVSRPSLRVTPRSSRTFLRIRRPSSNRDFGDPLDERIYLEESNGDIANPEPVPVIHSAAFLQRKRGVWQEQVSRKEIVNYSSIAFFSFLSFFL